MTTIMAVNNETENSVSRVTKEGRHLTYEMKVIQQPERARACGSGAKSSADRRPVDPPPVVELHIYEGESRNDVTFPYNANFFLYTTLENARPIAHGRVPNAQNSFPVLTGTPVAGMAYLDRPSPAGYFIFPDLSVRHEGKYRLSFNLYEELKEPNDEDAESPAVNLKCEDTKPQQNNPMAPKSHVHFRLEVKSAPFSVYSAKKFPGLAESTNLSRVVAEQGCRVRIRRDVRMRRRDGPKTKGSYEEYEDETYVRSDRYATPDMYSKPQIPGRPRSISNGSMDTVVPLSADRRTSGQDGTYYNQAGYQQHPLPTPQPQNVSGTYTSHLAFGSHAAHQFSAPTFQPPSTTVSQPSQSYAQSNHNYPYPTSTHPRQISNSQNGVYPQPQAPQQPVYNQNQMYSENSDFRQTNDYRRTSLPSNHQGYPPQGIISYSQTDNRQTVQQNYYQQTIQPTASRVMTPSNGQALPPILKPLQPPLERKYEPNSQVNPQPTITGPCSEYEMPNKYPLYPPAPHLSNPGSARSTKRPFASVFDSDHLNQPMHGGMRPSNASHGQEPPQIEADNDISDDYGNLRENLLQYKRADGSRQYKKCPSPISE